MPQGGIFFRSKNFFLMMRVDSPLLNQSASGLNFYVNIGCSLLADAIFQYQKPAKTGKFSILTVCLHKINYLSSLSNAFYPNNSIYKILTTPSSGVVMAQVWGGGESADGYRATFSLRPNSSESEKSLVFFQSINILCLFLWGFPWHVTRSWILRKATPFLFL